MTCQLRDPHEQWRHEPHTTSRSVKVFRCQLPHTNQFYSRNPPKYDGTDRPLGSGAPLCTWCGTWKADKVCSSCKKARYCSEKHQIKKFVLHLCWHRFRKSRGRWRLAEALYQKGLALSELSTLKDASSALEPGNEQTAKPKDDPFEENFKELKKWVDVKAVKYRMLTVINEKRHIRLETTLKVLDGMIQFDDDPPKRKFYDTKLSLIDNIGWKHVVARENDWMLIRFPLAAPYSEERN